MNSITTQQDWVLTLGLAMVPLLGAALPFVSATVVAMRSATVEVKRPWFVGVSGVLVFGVATLFSVAVLPFSIFDRYLMPQLESEAGGRVLGSRFIDAIQEWWVWLELGVFVVACVAVPVVLSKRVWPVIQAGLGK